LLSFSMPKGPSPVASPVPASASALDQQLQHYARVVTARDRDVERVGPFTATFDPHTTNPFLNYAIPDDGAAPSAGEVAALVAAFARRGLQPRLEFLPSVAPAAEAALRAGGFAVEAHLVVMTCTVDDVVALSPAPGIAIEAPRSDEDLRQLRSAQHRAFGVQAPAVGDDEVARQRAALAAGTLALAARDVATGAIVGGGVATAPAGGVTEIAGIGVLEGHRRRGIAGAITAGLARAAFAAGQTTAWLTPGDDGAHRVYARAGFVDRSAMLHLSVPQRS
jgi:GNAT superfamily N-acetyltransferase